MSNTEFNFVNRGEELAVLKNALKHRATPALIVLRSPTGYGKSRLTSQLISLLGCADNFFCIVDPEVGIGNTGLYDGYFIQRCADQLSAMSSNGMASWPNFEDFLRSRRWRTVKEKKATDLAAELPSLKSAYAILLDYTSRAFSFGRFAPKKILTSDSHEAIKVCEDYIGLVLREQEVKLIIRGAQLIDTYSLRYVLDANRVFPGPGIIMEYTCENGEFSPIHQKIIHSLVGAKNEFYIMDLTRLSLGHLNYLLQNEVDESIRFTAESYIQWNGNIRAITEIQYQVVTTRKVEEGGHLGGILDLLAGTLDNHLMSLSSLEKIILTTCVAHIEAISGIMLASTAFSLTPLVTPLALEESLRKLICTHRFLVERVGQYHIENEAVTNAVRRLPVFQNALVLAEKALRDQYKKLTIEVPGLGVTAGSAVRQVFRLCARTKDVLGLRQAVDLLSEEIKQANDQSIYVEIVSSAITANPEIYSSDYSGLSEWAASIAYDIGAWSRAVEIIDLLPSPNTADIVMRACALQEIGRHEEALSLARSLQAIGASDDSRVAAKLIESIIAGCQGNKDTARQLLDDIVTDPTNTDSHLLGYAHRFFEVVDEYSGCIYHLYQSISCFKRFGLWRSAAYSQAAAAVLKARNGEIAEARMLINESAHVLSRQTQNRHLILNNIAAVDLLSDAPDYASCKAALAQALRYVRDDYSEVTILSNITITYAVLEEWESALISIDRIMNIIRDHDFADTEIYWPLCFNLARVLQMAGRHEESQRIMRFPREHAHPPLANQNYWGYRYGDVAVLETGYQFLATRPYHPLYLSHWLIDSDGINMLRQEPRQ